MVHITYPILCMSYSYTYITFMVIYHIPFVMFYFHVLFSYIVFMLYFSYYFFFHINFSDHFTLLYIFIYHVGLYTLMLQNLSSHNSAMLLISYHIFSTCHIHIIYFMFHACKYQRNGYRKLIRARRRCTHCTKQWSYQGPKAMLSLYETMIIL